jgi:hypothetical protein
VLVAAIVELVEHILRQPRQQHPHGPRVTAYLGSLVFASDNNNVNQSWQPNIG